MEARVVVEGGQRALNSGHGGVVDGGATRKFLQQQSQIGTVHQLLAGGIAGAFSKTCTAPLARLTILFQVGFSLALYSVSFVRNFAVENAYGGREAVERKYFWCPCFFITTWALGFIF